MAPMTASPRMLRARRRTPALRHGRTSGAFPNGLTAVAVVGDPDLRRGRGHIRDRPLGGVLGGGLRVRRQGRRRCQTPPVDAPDAVRSALKAKPRAGSP